jgi:hypothetical protein
LKNLEEEEKKQKQALLDAENGIAPARAKFDMNAIIKKRKEQDE